MKPHRTVLYVASAVFVTAFWSIAVVLGALIGVRYR